MLWRAKLLTDVDLQFVYGQMLRRNARNLFYVLHKTIKPIVFLCMVVPCAMPVRVPRAVLLVYVDCWKYISEPSHVYMQGVKR